MTQRNMNAVLRAGALAGLVALLWCTGARAGSDPTPATIVANWNTLSGGVSAKVVYWEAATIRIMNLNTGAVTDVIARPDDYSELSACAYPVWSPDGTKICYFVGNPRQFWVVNEDGSDPTMIVGGVDWDYGANSWWSSNGGQGDWIVAQKDNMISRYQVNANNSPGSVVDIYNPGGGVDWLSMSGDYIGFTLWGGHGAAGNASIVRNWKTSAELDTVPTDEDACSMNIKQDGSGTNICCHDSHFNAEVRNFGGTLLDTWATLGGGKIEMMRWSNHPDYICNNDFRQLPRADQRAWIRKLASDVDTGQYLFLGYGMWGPDVYVDPNNPPVATAQSVSTDEDVALSITLAGTDVDGDTLTYNVVTQPAHGTLTGTAPDMTYTPAENYNGPDSFTFKANDGQADSAAATVSITVDPVDDPPVALDDSVTVAEDVTCAVTLQATEVDGDSLTYNVAAAPAHGTLTGTAPNLTYEPDADYNGSDQFTFTVNDGTTTSPAATVDITVTPVNDAPAITSASASPAGVTLPGGTTLTASASDVDLDGLTYAWSVGSGATVVSPTAATTTATFAATGPYVFTIAVSDGTATTSRTVTVVVSDAATDTDGDGMADDWEIDNFGDLSRDGAGDADSDGLSDLDEFVLDTDPYLTDTDGDGMEDGDEADNFFDPADDDQDDNGTLDGDDDWDDDGTLNAVDPTPGYPSSGSSNGGSVGSVSCGSSGSAGAMAAWVLACIALIVRRRRVAAR